MNNENALQDLKNCFINSPQPSFKVTNYFQIYSEIFAHLRDVDCTFIETGVLNGGSLFMWRKWLGEKARIIGVDLNPSAKKWEEYGFEIYIGDQGDSLFWQNFFREIGPFDVLLDDGGHQSFQQIVTLTEAIKAAKNKCIIAIEDTCTSFFKEFSGHGEHSFLEYTKDSTDALLAKTSEFWPGQFPPIVNSQIEKQFSSVYSIQFYSGLVAYTIDPVVKERPKLIWNHLPKSESAASDFRNNGTSQAIVDWPDLFKEQKIVVKDRGA
jgi:hypothetical protein